MTDIKKHNIALLCHQFCHPNWDSLLKFRDRVTVISQWFFAHLLPIGYGIWQVVPRFIQMPNEKSIFCVK